MKHVIDANNQTLGRLATQIAAILQGKNSTSYNPRLPGVDEVLIKNAGKIKVTGTKAKQKIYYRHTGYMGHLRKPHFEDVMKKDPAEIIRYAVFNMLPKNFIRQNRMNRLKFEK